MGSRRSLAITFPSRHCFCPLRHPQRRHGQTRRGNEVLVKKLQQAPAESFACEETFAKACRAAYPQIEKPMTYLRKLHFECGETEIDNFNFYLKLCAKHNLIPKC